MGGWGGGLQIAYIKKANKQTMRLISVNLYSQVQLGPTPPCCYPSFRFIAYRPIKGKARSLFVNICGQQEAHGAGPQRLIEQVVAPEKTTTCDARGAKL